MPTLTRIFEAKDKEDAFLQNGCIMPVMDKNTSEFFKWKTLQNPTEKPINYDDYFYSILEACKSLQKAKEHRKRYVLEKKKAIKKIQKDISQEPSQKNLDLRFDLAPVLAEFEAFLMQIKKCLDSISSSFNDVYATQFPSWKRGTENGKKVSGLKVIRGLENLSKKKFPRIDVLIAYLHAQKENISLIVFMRDKLIHPRKQLEIVTNFQYLSTLKIVRTPHVKIDQGYMEIEDFMLQTNDYMANFLQDCIILTLDSLDEEIRVGRNPQSEIVFTMASIQDSKQNKHEISK